MWSIQNHTPTLPKSYSDFTKITLRLYQNHTPTLPKAHSDFTKITGWFSQHHWLIFTKSHPTLPKSHADLDKSLTDFHKNEGWFWSPRLLFYCTPFQNCTLPHCASSLSEGFSSFVTSLSGSPHCFCPCLWKQNLVLFTGSSCLAFHHFAVLR